MPRRGTLSKLDTHPLNVIIQLKLFQRLEMADSQDKHTSQPGLEY